ncbi:MAG: VOC family protein [Alphaproteobacteria bacterium]|jgi:uncharacterized glyoxalase superfamily protein PhnB
MSPFTKYSPPIAPYLTVTDANRAIRFYKQAFDARERRVMPASDGQRLRYAELEINGGVVMLADEFEDDHASRAPDVASAIPVAMSVALDDPEAVDRWWGRAVAQGAAPEAAPADTFWGARVATLRDPFGHRWMLSASRG